MTDFIHTPVMVQEVLEALHVAPGGVYCDGTMGMGGHAFHILQRSGETGRLIGMDRDPEAVAHARQVLAQFGDRVTLEQGNFRDIVSTLSRLGMVPVDGILLDLGVSSFQLTTARRGFSLSADGPLDMRMDPSDGLSAAELVAQLPERELAQLLRNYGEETASKRIAHVIKEAALRGELTTTASLAQVVTAAVGGYGPRRGKIHPATRTFMALRIAVNDELGSLRRFLDTFTEALKPGGRVAIISFHSLEDRMVKQSFSRLAKPCRCPPGLPVCACGEKPKLNILTRRPLQPTMEEVKENPRARSARLRAAERI